MVFTPKSTATHGDWSERNQELLDILICGSMPGSEDPLEEEMATHPSILAREIPWTEEPGGIQSMGLQKS